MILDELKNRERFAIYGAQVVAYGAYRAIAALSGKTPECFIVSSRQGNPGEIEGIPVSALAEAPHGLCVVIGVSSLLQEECRAALTESGYTDILILTDHEEFLLMSAYFDSMGRFPLIDSVVKHPSADLTLYEVGNHRDKKLRSHPSLMPCECAIQAGAALTGERIAMLTDDTGVNISHKNRQYCEMSAAYWIWKNAVSDWVGLEHYRRHILIRPELLSEEIDAVLPLPYLAYPNTLSQFRRFVSQTVLDALLTALRELHPDAYEQYLAILNGQLQYTYNLVCAKKSVYDAYCAWFFHITEHMETMTDRAPEIGTTRALSYVAEVLTNLYFMSHQDDLAIRHVERSIYI